MQRQFFSGNSIEQAVMAAARHYKVEPEKLAYKLREKKHGFLNVRKRIVIVVDPDAPALTDEQIAAQKAEAQPTPPAKDERASRSRGRKPREESSKEPQEAEEDIYPDDVDEDESDEDHDSESRRTERSGRGRSKDRDDRGRGGRRGQDHRHSFDRGEEDRDEDGQEEDGRDEYDRDEDDQDDEDRGNRGDRRRDHRGRDSRRDQDSRDQNSRDSRGKGGRGRGGRDQGSRNQGGRNQRSQGGRDQGRHDHGHREKSSSSDRDQRSGRSSRGRGRKDSRRDKRRPVEINEFEWLGVDWDETEIKDEVERDLAAYELALEQVLDVMDLDIEYSLESGEVMELDFEGEDSEVLLEDDGRVLKAIEHILPRMVRSLVDKSIPCNADCEGFRASHEKRLEDMAHDAAETAVETGRKKLLPPMNPADRRIVHLALVDREDVETVSEGHGFMKRVKVLPVDDPEMDDDDYDD